MILRSTFLLFLSAILYMQPAAAVKIVRLQLEYGGAGEATGGFAFSKVTPVLDLELFDDVTPGTVTNYLNYVNDGRYDLTFINRSIPGFVLQTGGVTNISEDPINEPLGPSSFGTVFPYPVVVTNEPELSNLRGTIAMAKAAAVFEEGDPCVEEGPDCTLVDGTGPDSATSEWFINLKNNSDPLDADNGGFTVFGSVIDDGMNTADEVASFPTTDLSFLFGSSFFDVPFADFDRQSQSGVGRFQRNLIMIISATEISRPILRFSPTISDFGFISQNTEQSLDIVVTNTGNEVLNISAINTSVINAPFTIQSENCLDASLDPIVDTPLASCTISLLFSPAALGQFDEKLVIEYTGQSGEVFSVTHPLSGEAAIGPPVISVPTEFNVGISQVDGLPAQEKLLVVNLGNASLKITNLSGLSATNFSQTNDCLDNGSSIAAREFCSITVSYAASDFDLQKATLIIESNDPVNSSVTVILSGSGDTDSDGVLSTIEQASPNQGDGNNDGISDDVQNNVVSFEMGQGLFLTLAAEDAQIAKSLNAPSEVAFTRVKRLDTTPTKAPLSSFDYGNYQFNINLPNNGIVGDAVRVALFFPVEVAPSTYYRYGATPDNTTPHWYDFSFDAETQTGATFIGEVSIPSESGATITRNMVILNFIDGARGDDDLLANGRIEHAVGGVDATVSSGSSSGGSAAYLWLISFLLFFRRGRFVTLT